MTLAVLRALVNWFMCSDPWPDEHVDQEIIENWLNEKSREFGFEDWIDALHRL